MKKKLLMILLIGMLSVSFVSCEKEMPKNEGETTAEDASNDAEKTVAEAQQPKEEDQGSVSDLEAIGDIEVEKELFDVNLTIPSEYMGELSAEEIEQKAAEGGYKVAINDDGSATYTMTKKQHKEMMKEITESINSSLAEMVGSESYPNFTGVAANEDFTNFTITTSATEIGMNESFSVMALYMYGGMYGIFNGENVENIHVDFVNSDSGEIIHSADSSETANGQ